MSLKETLDIDNFKEIFEELKNNRINNMLFFKDMKLNVWQYFTIEPDTVQFVKHIYNQDTNGKTIYITFRSEYHNVKYLKSVGKINKEYELVFSFPTIALCGKWKKEWLDHLTNKRRVLVKCKKTSRETLYTESVTLIS